MSFQIIQFLNVFFYAESDTKSDTQLCLLKKSLELKSSCPYFLGQNRVDFSSTTLINYDSRKALVNFNAHACMRMVLFY